LQAPKLRVQNIPTEKLRASIDYKSGLLEYKLEGQSLGGTFEMDGQLPLTKPAAPAREGHLRINDIAVSKLLAALNAGAGVDGIRGRFSVAVDFEQAGPSDWPTGTGQIQLRDLRYKDRTLASSARADLVLAKGSLRLRDFNTSFGGGVLRARMALDFEHAERSSYSIDIDNVEAAQVVAPWLGETVQGPIRARIRGRGSRETEGTIDVELAHGTVAGVPVTSVRLPLRYRFAPASGRGEIETRDASAQVGHGQATGRLTANWEDVLRVDGQVKFSRVDVGTVLQQTIGSSQIGGGMMTGRFDFAARDLRSANDLTGSLIASFEQSQALNLPILQQVAPYLGVSPSTTFQKGNASARLDRGLFRIQQFALEGANLKVHVDGTVALDERLNLSVTANTGSFGLDFPGSRLLRLRIPLFGPLPVQVAQQAINFLSNRVIHLEVTGTTRSPNIRVRPLATLSEEGIRFFLDRTVAVYPVAP
jgi:translocation and assembly module TamB